MKRAVNFRLDNQTITTLSLLEERLNISKTAIVEKAVPDYAKKKLMKQAQYMNYAGCLSEEDSGMILKAIRLGHDSDINSAADKVYLP